MHARGKTDYMYLRHKCHWVLRNAALVIIPVELSHSTGKGGKDQKEYKQELPDIYQHTAQRYLEGSEMLISLSQVYDSRKAKHIGHCEQPLC